MNALAAGILAFLSGLLIPAHPAPLRATGAEGPVDTIAAPRLIEEMRAIIQAFEAMRPSCESPLPSLKWSAGLALPLSSDLSLSTANRGCACA